MDNNWKDKFFKVYFDDNSTLDEIDNILELKNDNIPKYLFKYTGINHVDDLLENNLFYLSGISELNDPYEGNIIYDLDLQTERFLDHWIKESSIRPQIKIEDIDFDKEIDTIMKLIDDIEFHQRPKKVDYEFILSNSEDTSKIIDIMKNVQEKEVVEFFESLESIIIKNTKLICLTESNKNNPMWNHYGCEHEGICIRYDTKEFPKYIIENCFPVDYDNSNITDSIPINDAKKLNKKYNLKVFLRKSVDWRCENEWRIIATDSFREKYSFKKNNTSDLEYLRLKPSAVYLGKEFPENDEKIIRQVCKNNNIKLYRMKQSKTQYELVEEPL